MLLLSLLLACTEVANPDGSLHEQELITTVVLTLTAGDEQVEVRWSDPELDGDPVVDDLVLANGVTWQAAVSFLDELQEPIEDLTSEIDAESDEHQLFFLGDAVNGPASSGTDAPLLHSYADEDSNGLPVGLNNELVSQGVGSGDLTIVLQHLPTQDGEPQKTADLAAVMSEQGAGALPGEADAVVTFSVQVE